MSAAQTAPAPDPIHAEVARALVPYGIVPGAVETLSGGLQNQVWRVRDGARWVVLRRSTPSTGVGRRRSASQVAWEHALLAHLRTSGLPVPAPLPARDGTTWQDDGEGGGWSLFPYLPGTPIHWSSATPPTPAQGDAGIDALIAIHAAARAYPSREPRPVVGRMVDLPRWICDAFPGVGDVESGLRRALERVPAASAARNDLCRHVDAVGIVLDAMARAAADFDRERVELIPIHGDFGPWNLGHDGDRVVAIYDFDDACLDVRAMDVAMAIDSWASTGRDRFDEATAIRLLRRYQRASPLSSTELRHLPTCFAAKKMFYVLPRVLWQVRDPAQDHGWVHHVFMPGAIRHLAARDQWERIVAAAVG